MTNDEKVRIITGRARTGKTHTIIEAISENEKRGEKSLLIVPSGSTFEYEKRLARACGGGYMNTKVFGFYMLGEMILQENGLKNKFINSQGRVMVIRHAVEKAELAIFGRAAKRPGFALMCDDIITNFVACEFTHADVKAIADSLPEGSVLRLKLTDLAEIYRLTDEYLKKTGNELRAASETICSFIPQSKYCNAHVYIDGIENPGKQTYEMIKAMLTPARSMTISIGTDENSSSDVFLREKRILERVRREIENAGYSCLDTEKLERAERYRHKVMEHIERELWSQPPTSYAGGSQEVELIEAGSIRSEVDMLCSAITAKAKAGIRYRRMAVIATDGSRYDTRIKSMFSELHIPLFCDNSISLSSTAPACLLICALKCVADGLKAEDVIALIKTGLTDVSRDEAERFENYIIECGITGARLKEPFTGEKKDVGKLEDTRRAIIEPLGELHDALSRAVLRDKLRGLTEYMEKLDVEKKTTELSECIRESGDETGAKQYEQVYRLLCDLIRQLSVVMGESTMSMEELSDVLLEGLSADIISIIPPGADMVTFGSLSTELSPDIDHVFIIGANDGLFPPVRDDDGIIDDKELRAIGEQGNEVWLSVESRRLCDAENLYNCISAASEYLYISYPQVSAGGEKILPAPLLMRLQKMLGEKPFISDSDINCKYALHTMDSVAAALRRYADTGMMSEDMGKHITQFMHSTEHADECERLCDAVFFDPSPESIGSETAGILYGKERLEGSVSRLETFNKCPFSHFMTYGLRARERKEFSAESSDDGSFFHDVADRFCRRVKNDNVNLREISDVDADKLIDTCIEDEVREYRNGLYSGEGRMCAYKNYLTIIAKKFIRAIIAQIKEGEYDIEATEAKFGNSDDAIFPPYEADIGGTKLVLSGKIDRIDSIGGGHAQVVDYKRSKNSAKFSLDKVYAGLQIQLPIYLNVITSARSDASGMFYMPIDTDEKSPDRIKLEKAYRMRGFILADKGIVEARTGKSVIDRDNLVIAEKSDGRSVLLTAEQLKKICDFAAEKAKTTAKEILSGDISVSPYYTASASRKGACEYCKFGSVCMFDQSLSKCSYRPVPHADLSEMFGDETE